MTQKTFLVLAVIMICTLPALAADTQPTGGTAGSVSKSSSAISAADWDSFLKRHSLDSHLGLGGGSAGLLSHSGSLNYPGVDPFDQFRGLGTFGFNPSGLGPKIAVGLSHLALIETLRHGTLPADRRAAAEELGKLRCESDCKDLSDAVQDPDASVGEAAFHALAGMSPYCAIWARWNHYIMISVIVVAVLIFRKKW